MRRDRSPDGRPLPRRPGRLDALSPRRLDPSSFSFVMATGIVATAARLRGLAALADGLVAVAALAHAVLTALSLVRVVRHGREVLVDLRHPGRSFGFFTFVAATDVLAACLLTAGHDRVALGLLAVAAAAWLALGYVVPAAVVTSPLRPALASANGSWFLWVVASQSVAVAAAGLERTPGPLREELAVLAVLTWSIGLVLYPVTAILLTLRMVNHRPTPHELNPNFWVSMGAVAITVFAGARIVEMTNSPIVTATRGLVAGMAVILWSFASWLIPALVGLGVWRHLVRGVRLRFEASWWSIVFPLGMYSVAAMHLGAADQLPFVNRVGRAWFWVALAAWLVASGGLVGNAVTQPAPGPGDSSSGTAGP